MTDLKNNIQSSTQLQMPGSCLTESGIEFTVYIQSCVTPEHHRKAYTCLRLSSHRLKIEIGHWSQTPHKEQKSHCSKSIQSEEHVISHGELTDDIRRNYPSLSFTNIQSFFENANQ